MPRAFVGSRQISKSLEPVARATYRRGVRQIEPGRCVGRQRGPEDRLDDAAPLTSAEAIAERDVLRRIPDRLGRIAKCVPEAQPIDPVLAAAVPTRELLPHRRTRVDAWCDLSVHRHVEVPERVLAAYRSGRWTERRGPELYTPITGTPLRLAEECAVRLVARRAEHLLLVLPCIGDVHQVGEHEFLRATLTREVG